MNTNNVCANQTACMLLAYNKCYRILMQKSKLYNKSFNNH